MPTITDLRASRANIWSQMTEIIDAAGDNWTVDQRTTYDNLENRLDELDKDIERAERHETRATEYAKVDRTGVVAPTGNAQRGAESVTYESVFNRYLARGMGRLTAEEQNVLASGHVDPSGISNALSVGTDSAGGYLVPAGWRDEFVVQMLAYGNVQAVAQVIRTASGQDLSWPTMNDTGNVGRLLAENTQMTETDVVVGTATLGAYVYSSDLTRVSLQLANDSAFDVGTFVRAAHAERIGRITNQHFTTGTGTAQPQGIVTGATSGVTAASTTAITADELIQLQHAVDPAYRNDRSQFMFSDAVLSSVRRLQDANSQYLWQPGLQAGEPDRILGRPYVINNDMADPAAGVKSVLYGDFQAGYVIRIVQDIQVITFTERYMDYLQVGHSSFMRADGKTQNASAYKALTQAAV